MQAGLLAYWLCEYEGRCEACPLDAALRHLHPAGDAAALPAAEPAAVAPVAEFLAAASAAIANLDRANLYHPHHTWVRKIADDRVRVGVDAFALQVAGAPRSVVIVQPGTRVRRDHACAWLDEPGGTLAIQAPLSGVVLAVNPAVLSSPATLAADPFGDGWLFELQPSDLPGESPRLASAERFVPRLEHDALAWRRRIQAAMRNPGAALGTTLGDGGAPVQDLDVLLGVRRRLEIAAEFLGSGRVAR
jgi:glycine cleavage system H protein